MTTSSDNNSKSPLSSRTPVNHWTELSDRLPAASTERFGNWFDIQLAVLEKSQERFVTGRSLMKSLRR
jgi:hypothetical protein